KSESATEATVTTPGSATPAEGLMCFPIIRRIVDHYVSSAQPFREIERFIDVSGENCHLQAVSGAVGKFDGLIVAVHRNERNDWSKCLFLIQQRVGGYVVDHGWLEKHIRLMAGPSFAAKNNASPFFQCIREVTFCFLQH